MSPSGMQKPTGLQKVVTWFPAIILPTATGHQLWLVLTKDSVEAVSVWTWGLFFLANLGAIWLGSPRSTQERLQKHLAFTLTAVLDVVIIGAVLVRG